MTDERPSCLKDAIMGVPNSDLLGIAMAVDSPRNVASSYYVHWFHTATVRPKRSGPIIPYNTPLTIIIP